MSQVKHDPARHGNGRPWWDDLPHPRNVLVIVERTGAPPELHTVENITVARLFAEDMVRTLVTLTGRVSLSRDGYVWTVYDRDGERVRGRVELSWRSEYLKEQRKGDGGGEAS